MMKEDAELDQNRKSVEEKASLEFISRISAEDKANLAYISGISVEEQEKQREQYQKYEAAQQQSQQKLAEPSMMQYRLNAHKMGITNTLNNSPITNKQKEDLMSKFDAEGLAMLTKATKDKITIELFQKQLNDIMDNITLEISECMSDTLDASIEGVSISDGLNTSIEEVNLAEINDGIAKAESISRMSAKAPKLKASATSSDSVTGFLVAIKAEVHDSLDLSPLTAERKQALKLEFNSKAAALLVKVKPTYATIDTFKSQLQTFKNLFNTQTMSDALMKLQNEIGDSLNSSLLTPEQKESYKSQVKQSAVMKKYGETFMQVKQGSAPITTFFNQLKTFESNIKGSIMTAAAKTLETEVYASLELSSLTPEQKETYKSQVKVFKVMQQLIGTYTQVTKGTASMETFFEQLQTIRDNVTSEIDECISNQLNGTIENVDIAIINKRIADAEQIEADEKYARQLSQEESKLVTNKRIADAEQIEADEKYARQLSQEESKLVTNKRIADAEQIEADEKYARQLSQEESKKAPNSLKTKGDILKSLEMEYNNQFKGVEELFQSKMQDLTKGDQKVVKEKLSSVSLMKPDIDMLKSALGLNIPVAAQQFYNNFTQTIKEVVALITSLASSQPSQKETIVETLEITCNSHKNKMLAEVEKLKTSLPLSLKQELEVFSQEACSDMDRMLTSYCKLAEKNPSQPQTAINLFTKFLEQQDEEFTELTTKCEKYIKAFQEKFVPQMHQLYSDALTQTIVDSKAYKILKTEDSRNVTVHVEERHWPTLLKNLQDHVKDVINRTADLPDAYQIPEYNNDSVSWEHMALKIIGKTSAN